MTLLLLTSVGADLSRTPPIYRPSLDVLMSESKVNVHVLHGIYSILTVGQTVCDESASNGSVVLDPQVPEL